MIIEEILKDQHITDDEENPLYLDPIKLIQTTDPTPPNEPIIRDMLLVKYIP